MRTLLCATTVCLLTAAVLGAGIGKVTVTAEQAPIMQGKEVVLTAKKGDTFDVAEIKGDWYGVLPSRGWIHKANVRFEPNVAERPAGAPVTGEKASAPASAQSKVSPGATVATIPAAQQPQPTPDPRASKQPAQKEITGTRDMPVTIEDVDKVVRLYLAAKADTAAWGPPPGPGGYSKLFLTLQVSTILHLYDPAEPTPGNCGIPILHSDDVFYMLKEVLGVRSAPLPKLLEALSNANVADLKKQGFYVEPVGKPDSPEAKAQFAAARRTVRLLEVISALRGRTDVSHKILVRNAELDAMEAAIKARSLTEDQLRYLELATRALTAELLRDRGYLKDEMIAKIGELQAIELAEKCYRMDRLRAWGIWPPKGLALNEALQQAEAAYAELVRKRK